MKEEYKFPRNSPSIPYFPCQREVIGVSPRWKPSGNESGEVGEGRGGGRNEIYVTWRERRREVQMGVLKYGWVSII